MAEIPEAERAADLAEEIETENLYLFVGPERSELIVRALRHLAETAPTPISNCARCGRIVDTREEKDGGDKFGCELADGRWTCSIECYDVLTGEASSPASADLREVVAKALHDRVRQPGFCSDEDAADATLSAISAAGYVIVPRGPTHEMLMAGYYTACKYGLLERLGFYAAEEIHEAMIRAALAAQETGQ